jgi:cysteine synthase
VRELSSLPLHKGARVIVYSKKNLRCAKKAICAAYGAEIKVTTEEGKGSCFRVELPILKLALKDHALHNGVAS